MATKATVLSALVGLALASGFGTANAAFQSCVNGDADPGTNYNIADNVTPNIGCTILLPLDGAVNDDVSPPPSSYTVNVEQFFGFSDWQFDGKWEGNGTFTDSSDLYNFTGGALSGTFTSIDPFPSDISEVMFVFKDGSSTNLVGYLITPGADGTYTSPFEEPPFDFQQPNTRDISHISVYFRDDGGPPIEIPEPSSLALLALGLLGLGRAIRRIS